MRILHGLARFSQTGEGDVKQLQNFEPPELRLRLGVYRIRYYDHFDTMEILAVKHRSNVYH